MYLYSTIVNLPTCNRNYSLGHLLYFFYSRAPNFAGAKAFFNLTSNERSLKMGQVIKMSLKPNERYDLNS